MRNFVITYNGKSYQVGVEEVGATATPVAAPVVVAAPVAAPVAQAAPAAAPVAAPAPAPAAKAAPVSGEEIKSPFPEIGRAHV